jgi:hypothetical protein
MSESKKYNGWTNYETWNVALWIGNEQGSKEPEALKEQNAHPLARREKRRKARELAKMKREARAHAELAFSRRERATLDLAETWKEAFEENAPTPEAGPYSDILGAAMSEINWYEIAEHYISDVADSEEADEEEQKVSR